jgi:ABC-2 type transport system ATP-binding protein
MRAYASLWSFPGAGVLRLRLSEPERREEAEWVLAGTLGVPLRCASDPTVLTARVSDPERAAFALVQLARAGIPVREFSFAQPGLTAVPRGRSDATPNTGAGDAP